MVFYQIETIIVINFVEKVTTHYMSFPNNEDAKKYFTNLEATYTECRSNLKSNRIKKPIWKEVASIPKRSIYGSAHPAKTKVSK